MQTVICTVCKQPIDDMLVVQTDKGSVHPGPCLQHAQELPVTESDFDNVLVETELLL